jgi:protein TonB
MAREGLRSHLSGSVPVSIVVHLVVLLVLVVIPLADVVLPIPVTSMPSYVLAAALPPPPAPVPVRTVPTTSTPSPASSGAPTQAPDHIVPESVTAPPSIAVDGGDSGIPGVGVESGIVTPTPPPPPAPEQPRPQGPVRVAQLPEPPHKIGDVRPVYPEIARAAHKEGTVILEAVLDPTGRVTQLRVIRSEPLLDQAALDAVRQWRYSPSMFYGKPVSVLMTITVRFTLQQ